MEQLKTLLANIVTQWLMRALGVIFGYFAVTEAQVYQIILALIAGGIALVGEWLQHKVLLHTEPPKFNEL